VFRPLRSEIEDAFMHGLQISKLGLRQFPDDHHDEIGIAMFVEISDCERTLKVSSDEVFTQNLLNTAHQFLQNGI